MNAIKPLTQLSSETQQGVSTGAEILAAYPACVSLFQIKEAAGATTITDIITGNTVTATITAGTVDHSKDVEVALSAVVSGAWPQTTTEDAIYFAIGNFQSAGPTFGNVVGTDNVVMAAANAITDGGTAFNLTAFSTTNEIQIRAIKVTNASPLNGQSIEYDGATYTANGVQSMTGITSITPSAHMTVGAGAAETYMIGILHFPNGAPNAAATKSILTWMYHNTVDDANKTICPLIKNRN